MEDAQRTPTTTAKKSKKASKLRSAPVSSADVPKSPGAGRHTKPASIKEHFSSLWEFFYDDGEGVNGDNVSGEGVDSEGGVGGQGRLKNIRGFLFKRRKSPLKGWHKRYFVLQGGILHCARNPVQLNKGKLLSRTDLGVAVVTRDSSRWRIDIDEERQVHHLKTKNASQFAAWSTCLLAHEMYRKAQLMGTEGVGGEMGMEGGEGVEEWMGKTQDVINDLKTELESVRENLEAMGIYIKPSQKHSDQPNTVSDNGSDTAGYSHQSSNDSSSGSKERRRWGKKKHDKKNKDIASVSQTFLEQPSSLSVSRSSSQLDELMEENIMKDDFSTTATTVYSQFSDILEKLEKVQKSFHECMSFEKAQKQQRQMLINNQQLMLRQSLLQNSDLKNRLSQIQALTSGIETEHMATPALQTPHPRTPAHSQAVSSSSLSRYRGKSLVRFDSLMSVQSTLSEKFFDALDDVPEISTEDEEEEEDEEGEVIEEQEGTESDGEESGGEVYSSLPAELLSSLSLSTGSRGVFKKPSFEDSFSRGKSDIKRHDSGLQRRTALPSPMVDVGDFSLWSILRKNIGKDLSRISMPVSLNEPLSALQRLCEEVQYSELLDEAAGLDHPWDRMVRVAAFAVSAYVTAHHRPARKPFNPILGETYEWIRQDKGFRFVAEQVSHHPPIAACHCESPNFTFWQDARIKSKFWGKSMEVFPVGVINLTIPKHDDHYQWEKVTSCIHNVLGGQRWVDQYGEMTITNKGKCSCKLTFVKASYWSSKKYEVHGDVYDSEGEKVRHLFGTWHEAMYCGQEGQASCVWQAAAMPPDSEQYYGFNRFAIQLNGFEQGMRDKLPQTDCRFRPDQRLLEEGFIEQAEQEKHRIEQIQREARAERERVGEDWTPNFFRKETRGGQECWVSCCNYWKLRETNFQGILLPQLW